MIRILNWMVAILGWFLGGPIGAVLGYFLGNTLKKIINDTAGKDFKNFSQAKYYTSKNRESFEINLLVLSAIVIKADGNVDKRELQFVRNYFVKIYGKQRAESAFKIFKSLVAQKNISTQKICLQIILQTTYAQRLQIVQYLFQLAKADEIITNTEQQNLKNIAQYLHISAQDVNTLEKMFLEGALDPYQTLEIHQTATDSEIKKAYRKLVKKHHPDKLKSLGETHMKAGKERFLKIQKAYEHIKKERNFN